MRCMRPVPGLTAAALWLRMGLAAEFTFDYSLGTLALTSASVAGLERLLHCAAFSR